MPPEEKLGFGKYGDLPLSQVPEDYLEWIIHNNEEKNKKLRDHLASRRLAAEAKMSWVERIVNAGFRSLAQQYHPDKGGTTAEMQEVNRAFENLKKKLFP